MWAQGNNATPRAGGGGGNGSSGGRVAAAAAGAGGGRHPPSPANLYVCAAGWRRWKGQERAARGERAGRSGFAGFYAVGVHGSVCRCDVRVASGRAGRPERSEPHRSSGQAGQRCSAALDDWTTARVRRSARWQRESGQSAPHASMCSGTAVFTDPSWFVATRRHLQAIGTVAGRRRSGPSALPGARALPLPWLTSLPSDHGTSVPAAAGPAGCAAAGRRGSGHRRYAAAASFALHPPCLRHPGFNVCQA